MYKIHQQVGLADFGVRDVQSSISVPKELTFYSLLVT